MISYSKIISISGTIFLLAFLSQEQVVDGICCHRMTFHKGGRYCGSVEMTDGYCCATQSCNIFCCNCDGKCIDELQTQVQVTETEEFPSVGETVLTVVYNLSDFSGKEDLTPNVKMMSGNRRGVQYVKTFDSDRFLQYVNTVRRCLHMDLCYLGKQDDHVYVSLNYYPEMEPMYKVLRSLGVTQKRFNEWANLGSRYH